MGTPLSHIPVKLIAGFIFSGAPKLASARRVLERKFGEADRETGILDFSCTRYYEKETGGNLKKKFLSFKNLIRLDQNYKVKLYTNKVEKMLSENNMRPVNIDPGYISLSKLVLFTTKNRSHRIYLDRGIYADLELSFSKKSFRPLPWTYPDYRSPEYIDFFNAVRALYLKQVKPYLKAGRKSDAS